VGVDGLLDGGELGPVLEDEAHLPVDLVVDEVVGCAVVCGGGARERGGKK
jgi:hypothetical protein